MQLLNASALLPAENSAAWRSQSYASRLRELVLRLSSGGGKLLPLSYCPDEFGRGEAHADKNIIAAIHLVFFMISISSYLSPVKLRHY
jgi:hypothetical protein